MGLTNKWNATSNRTEGTDHSRLAMTIPLKVIKIQMFRKFYKEWFSGTAGLVQRDSYYSPIVQSSHQQEVCRNGDVDAQPSGVYEIQQDFISGHELKLSKYISPRQYFRDKNILSLELKNLLLTDV